MVLIDTMVSRLRRLTHTQSYSDSATSTAQRGIQTQTMVDLINEALEVVHGIMFDNDTQAYVKTTTANISADTESVTIPTDAFLGLNVLSVEYKYGSESGDYRKLKKKTIHQRDTSSTGEPQEYSQRENTILLSPVPTSAVTDGLRITYEYQLPEVDVRRGKVSAVDDGSNPTSITITDKSLGDIALAVSDLSGTYITVVDKDGTQQMKSIPVSSYNSSTGVITLGSFTPDSGEAVAVNDYVVVGSSASSHSPYPRAVTPYIQEYVKRAVYELIGHPMAGTSERKLFQLQQRLESMFAGWETDIQYIAEIDQDRII